MRDEEPMDIEEEEEERPRRSPRNKRAPSSQEAIPWLVLKWASFCTGIVFCAIGLNRPAMEAAAFAGFGCFCAIAARLSQAEEHRYPRRD